PRRASPFSGVGSSPKNAHSSHSNSPVKTLPAPPSTRYSASLRKIDVTTIPRKREAFTLRALALLSLCLLASGAALALDPNRAITQYDLDSWRKKDGLPQRSVPAIARTRDGYLWVGTEEGLLRFDGAKFRL